MITNSFVLASLTVGGFYFIFLKLPKRIRKFLVEKPLFTDIVAAFFTYILFGGTATAIMAAGWACLFVSIMLAVRKNPILMGCIEKVKQGFKNIISWIETFGANDNECASEDTPSIITELH